MGQPQGSLCVYFLIGLCPHELHVSQLGPCVNLHSLEALLTSDYDDPVLTPHKTQLFHMLDDIVCNLSQKYYIYEDGLVDEKKLMLEKNDLVVVYNEAIRLAEALKPKDALITIRSLSTLRDKIHGQLRNCYTIKHHAICNMCGSNTAGNIEEHFLSPIHLSALKARDKLDQLKKELKLPTKMDNMRSEREAAKLKKMEEREQGEIFEKQADREPPRMRRSRSRSRTRSRSRSRGRGRSRSRSRGRSRGRSRSPKRTWKRTPSPRPSPRTRSPPRKKSSMPPCRYFKLGYCKRGNHCNYSHG